jgi:purine-nucleoside/S-methyl-5'-thioadenosine phosphorylase / adenosine deaminase
LYAYRSTHGPVDRPVHLAFTDRLGGVSGAPFDSLDLAIEGGGAAADRAENLRRVLDDFAPGAVLRDLHQVHGADVVEAAVDPPRERPRADAIVTDRAGVVLMVRAADCVPVLLADDEGRAVGAVHCGRPGLAAGVVPAAVARLRELGAERLTAWIGPHVCGACYEVPADLQEAVAAVAPESRTTTSWGTPSLDLGAGVRAQLADRGVRVVDASRCTRESSDLFSYRRDGAGAGRLAGLVRIEVAA